MWSQPLDADPGKHYDYSNFGYCVLGRVVERVSGQPYEERVRQAVLAPADATRMRTGHSLEGGRADGEVHYYDYPGAPLVPPVFPELTGRVSRPYGGFNLEAMGAAGGWIASPIDLLRFVTAIDGQRGRALLSPESVELMLARPPHVTPGARSYYGLGWQVRETPGGTGWYHAGALSGTLAYLARLNDGTSYAVVFNTRPEASDPFLSELDATLTAAHRRVTEWPAGDLFARYR
jgi:N-acyl-D-amino-acid deacylase